MLPAEHTRIVLGKFQELGVPFNTAWAMAMRTLPRRAPDYRDWKQALNWAKPAYRAHYERTELTCIHHDRYRSELHAQQLEALTAAEDLVLV